VCDNIDVTQFDNYMFNFLLCCFLKSSSDFSLIDGTQLFIRNDLLCVLLVGD
jgi:hypothetical protein